MAVARTPSVEVRIDDLSGPEIAALLGAHAALMEATSPPGSCHFLPINRLRAADVTVWTAWEAGALLACGALKELSDRHGEVKSMHTAAAYRGRGLGALMLGVILAEARARSYVRLSLETGSQPAFLPACFLYERHGFELCSPFGSYAPDENSVFYTLALRQS